MYKLEKYLQIIYTSRLQIRVEKLTSEVDLSWHYFALTNDNNSTLINIALILQFFNQNIFFHVFLQNQI